MYDTFSTNYDRFVNWQNRLSGEMPFIEQILQTLGPNPADIRVLDAAGGTGMHAIALAQRGYAAAAADLSPGMVERARQNAQTAGVLLELAAAGFGALEKAFGPARFDAVLCLGNSLPHLLDPRELLAALRDFSAVLRPGGLLLIQNRNFDAVLAAQERWMEPQGHTEGDAEWIFLRFYDYQPDGLIDFNVVTLHRAGANAPWQQSVATTRLYPLREGELTGALKEAGFVEVALYGNMSGAPFVAEKSGNLVVVGRKIRE